LYQYNIWHVSLCVGVLSGLLCTSFRIHSQTYLLSVLYYQQLNGGKVKGKVHPCTGTEALYILYGKVHPCTGTEALYRPYGKVHPCTDTEALYRPYGKVHPCTGTEALYRPYGP
jgi:hypothetical protein